MGSFVIASANAARSVPASPAFPARANEIADTLGTPGSASDQAATDSLLAAVRSRLGEAVAARSLGEGRALSLEAAIAEAQQVVADAAPGA